MTRREIIEKNMALMSHFVKEELYALWAEREAVTAYLAAVDDESGQAVALVELRRAHEEGQG